jgi:hypothetical protein
MADVFSLAKRSKAMGGAALIEVVIVIAGISIVIITTVAAYNAWQAARKAAMALPCKLFVAPWPFPDECLGTCTVGKCLSTGTRSYLLFWKQDTGCTCPGAGAAPGPLMGPTTGVAAVDAQH